jgi:hypothetical protein
MNSATPTTTVTGNVRDSALLIAEYEALSAKIRAYCDEIEAKHAAHYAKYPTDKTFEHWFVLRAPKYLARACTTLHNLPRNLAAGLALIPYDIIMFVPALYFDHKIEKEMRERRAKFNL